MTDEQHDPDRPTRLTNAELAELRARSARERGPFVDPAVVYKTGPTYHSRDWAEVILGHPLERLDWPTTHLLHLAMQAEPAPPETRELAARRREADADRRAAEEHRAETERLRAEQLATERQEWQALVEACPVPITVRENLSGRSRPRGGKTIGPLSHVTPDADAVSGACRQHPAGRGLCETPDRARPLRLGDPTGSPATCLSCKRYLARIRPAGTPQPKTPTRSQLALLELIDHGAIARVRHLRCGWAVRITTQRSKGPGGGLGRDVTHQAERLAAAGWATEAGGDPHTKPWQLTEAGRAVLTRQRQAAATAQAVPADPRHHTADRTPL